MFGRDTASTARPKPTTEETYYHARVRPARRQAAWSSDGCPQVGRHQLVDLVVAHLVQPAHQSTPALLCIVIRSWSRSAEATKARASALPDVQTSHRDRRTAPRHLRDGVELVHSASTAHEAGPLAGECERRRFADPARRAGDHDDRSLQPHARSLGAIRKAPRIQPG